MARATILHPGPNGFKIIITDQTFTGNRLKVSSSFIKFNIYVSRLFGFQTVSMYMI